MSSFFQSTYSADHGEMFSEDEFSEPTAPTNKEGVYTVSALTRSIRETLEASIGAVWVEGEISNYRRQSSGHHYFTLKDSSSQIDCVLFKGKANTAKEAVALLGDGTQVRLFGEVTVYELRGRYQIIVEMIQPCGQGSLQARFEALKRKLYEEGLFDLSIKKELPRFPRTVAIITSPTGAALRDMLQILARRAPWLPIVVCPVRVQGKGASKEIATAISQVDEWVAQARLLETQQLLSPTQLRLSQIDLIVVARGGGSIEDLWEFNEEIVARAIADCDLPVVSAVGHEIDFTIIDFVSDLRAPTPSAAAELIVPETEELLRQLAAIEDLLKRRLVGWVTRMKDSLQNLSERAALKRMPTYRLEEAKQRLDNLEYDFFKTFKTAVDQLQQRLLHATQAVQRLEPSNQVARLKEDLTCKSSLLKETAHRKLEAAQNKLTLSENLLRVLGPQATLKRGYTMTTNEAGTILRSAEDVSTNEIIITHFESETLTSRVV